jgi:hypothetical protein
MAGLTSDSLITSARVQARIPDGDEPLSNTSLLEYADKATVETILPELRSVREEYWVKREDIPVVSGTARYRIPSRAQGGAIRQIRMVATTGFEYSFTRISPEHRSVWDGQSGTPRVYILEGDEIVLIPEPNQTGVWTMRVRYYRRPSKLVPLASVNVISAIAGLNVGRMPPLRPRLSISFKRNLVSTVADDVDVTGIAGGHLIASVPNGPAVGDRLPPETLVPNSRSNTSRRC